MYFGDYVRETTTTTGTGTITLAGAIAQHQPFSAVVQIGDPVEYSILDANGTARETGIGTLASSTTLSRDTILSSTNSGAALSLSSGTHSVLLAMSANAANKRMVFGDAFVDYVVSGLALPGTGTLSGTMSAGIAYVVGQRVLKGSQTRTYTASKDTYVDLSNNGVLTYTEVTIGAAAPAIAVNSIRLGFVTSGASTITSGTDQRNKVRVASCVLGFTGGSVTIPTATQVPISFNNPAHELINNAGMHSTSTNPSRVTIVSAGLYSIATNFAIPVAGTSGGYYAIIAVNNVSVTRCLTGTPVDGKPVEDGAVAQIFLNSGDYVELQVYGQGSCTLTAAQLSVVRVG